MTQKMFSLREAAQTLGCSLHALLDDIEKQKITLRLRVPDDISVFAIPSGLVPREEYTDLSVSVGFCSRVNPQPRKIPDVPFLEVSVPSVRKRLDFGLGVGLFETGYRVVAGTGDSAKLEVVVPQLPITAKDYGKEIVGYLLMTARSVGTDVMASRVSIEVRPDSIFIDAREYPRLKSVVQDKRISAPVHTEQFGTTVPVSLSEPSKLTEDELWAKIKPSKELELARAFLKDERFKRGYLTDSSVSVTVTDFEAWLKSAPRPLKELGQELPPYLRKLIVQITVPDPLGKNLSSAEREAALTKPHSSTWMRVLEIAEKYFPKDGTELAHTKGLTSEIVGDLEQAGFATNTARYISTLINLNRRKSPVK